MNSINLINYDVMDVEEPTEVRTLQLMNEDYEMNIPGDIFNYIVTFSLINNSQKIKIDIVKSNQDGREIRRYQRYVDFGYYHFFLSAQVYYLLMFESMYEVYLVRVNVDN